MPGKRSLAKFEWYFAELVSEAQKSRQRIRANIFDYSRKAAMADFEAVYGS